MVYNVTGIVVLRHIMFLTIISVSFLSVFNPPVCFKNYCEMNVFFSGIVHLYQAVFLPCCILLKQAHALEKVSCLNSCKDALKYKL